MWKEGIIMVLFKPMNECSNNRPITLVGSGKGVHSLRHPQQSGFTLGRSKHDAILALRLLSEIHGEFNLPLIIACRP